MNLPKLELTSRILEKLGYSWERVQQFLRDAASWDRIERWTEKAYQWGVRQVDRFQAQYNVNPPETKRYEFVVQFHYRGKSRHADFRFQVNDHLLGWTLNEQIAGAIKEPVETMKDAEAYTRDWQKNSKINNEPGMQGKKLLVQTKAPEPPEWLTFEGVVPPGEVGATKEFEGVFSIFDRGIIEFGSQKPRFHEYFLHGKKLNGRWLVRQLPAVGLKPKEGVERKQEFVWFFWKAKDPIPYVITRGAINDRWVPPLGISALPKEIRKAVPPEFQYWKKTSRNQRLMVRDALYEAIKKKKVKLPEKFKASFHDEQDLVAATLGVLTEERLAVSKVPFVLQRHWWRGQIVVRRGASKEYFDLRFNFPREKKLRHYTLPDNPVETAATSAAEREPSSKEWMNPERYLRFDNRAGGLAIPSKNELKEMSPKARPKIPELEEENPTKDTPAFLSTVAKGKATFLIDKPDFKKIQFDSKQLKGVFTLERESKGAPLFLLKRAALPEPRKEQGQEIFSLEESIESRFIAGVALMEDEIKDIYYDGDEIKKAIPSLIGKQIRVHHAFEGYDNVGWVTNAFYDEDQRAGMFEGYVFEKFAVQRLDEERLNFVSPGFSYSLETVRVEGPNGEEGTIERKQACDIRFDEISLLENPASLFHRVLSKEVRMLESFRMLESPPHPMPKGVDVLKVDGSALAFVVLAKKGEPFPPTKMSALPEGLGEVAFVFDGKELQQLRDYPMPGGRKTFKVDAKYLDSIIIVRKGFKKEYPAAGEKKGGPYPLPGKKPLTIEGTAIEYVVLVPKGGSPYPKPEKQADYPLPSKAPLKVDGASLAYVFLAPKGFVSTYPAPKQEGTEALSEETTFKLCKEEDTAIIVPLLESLKVDSFDDEKLEVQCTIIRPGLSDNGNEYKREGLSRNVEKFEGLKCFDNHDADPPKHGRSTREQVGFWKNVFADEGGIHGTLEIFDSERWAFERMKKQVLNPKAKICGVSIDAMGRGRRYNSGGRQIRCVEDFVAVDSADLVGAASAGGTVDRLLEGRTEEVDLTMKEIKEKYPELLQEIQEEAMTAVREALAEKDSKIKELTDQNSELSKKIADHDLAKAVDEKLSSKEVKELNLKPTVLEKLHAKLEALGLEKKDGDKSNWDAAIAEEVKYLKEAGAEPQVESTKERGSETLKADKIDVKESKKKGTKAKSKKGTFSEDRLVKGIIGQFTS